MAARLITILAVAVAIVATAAEEQVWLSQGVTVLVTDSARFTLSNTMYLEHGEYFCDEEAFSARWKLSERWAVGGGASYSQDRVERVRGEPPDDVYIRHHWDWSGRPTEHLALDWSYPVGDWIFMDSHRIYMYFREDERDWAVYRNIATVTAPPVPHLPWSPRPYFTQFIYFSGRDCYDGHDRFSQFRSVIGMSVTPLEHLSLSAYWQYRDIETPSCDWVQFRIVGFYAKLVF